MKKIKNLTLGILGATILSLGLYACSNDNEVLDENSQSRDVENLKVTTSNSDDHNLLFEKSLRAIDPKLLKELDEANAKIYLSELHSVSLNYIFSKGFTKEEIIEKYDSLDDSRIINLATTVYSIEMYDILEKKENVNNQVKSLVYKDLTLSNLKDCAFRALGIDRLLDWAQGKYMSSYTARKALIRAVGKTAARLGLGYLGTALAVGEFVECMFE